MKIISPLVHGVIDYLVVLFLLSAPMLFGMYDGLATCTYALAGIHLVLTVLTNFNMGLIKTIPLPVHGFVEFAVGIVLVIIALTVLKDNVIGKTFYTAFGAAVLLVFFLSDYRQPVVTDPAL